MQTNKRSQLNSRTAYWKSQIASWKTSGLSQKQFCQREHLALSTFSYWKRKIGGRANSGVEFYPLALTSPSPLTTPKSTGLVLQVCRKRFAIEIEEGFSQAALTRLVSALEKL